MRYTDTLFYKTIIKDGKKTSDYVTAIKLQLGIIENNGWAASECQGCEEDGIPSDRASFLEREIESMEYYESAFNISLTEPLYALLNKPNSTIGVRFAANGTINVDVLERVYKPQHFTPFAADAIVVNGREV